MEESSNNINEAIAQRAVYVNNLNEQDMEGIHEKILELIREVYGKKAQLSDSLLLLGIDSVGMAELTLEVEKRFGIRVNDDIFDVETLAQLAEYIELRRQTTSSR